MAKVLMIGAGGVATVAAFKIAQNADVFIIPSGIYMNWR